MPNVSRSLLAASFAAGLLASAGPAPAQVAPNNPVGLWLLHWSFDTSAGMAQVGTQKICFLGNGTWIGTTFPAWSGMWFQKGFNGSGNGDRVRMTGNYAANVGNDSFEIDFADVNRMSGTWSEWRDNFSYLAWVRVTFDRQVGVACPLNAAQDSLPPADDKNPAGKIRE